MASSAGTVSIVEERSGSMKKIVWNFTAGSGASVNSLGSAQTSYTYNGKIQMLATIPGTSAPSASWDITVVDQSSVDVLAGAGGSITSSVILDCLRRNSNTTLRAIP